MDTNRCHRASRCALEAPRMTIAVTDELQESVGQGTNRALTAVCGSSVAGRGSSCKPSREPMCLGAMSGGVRDARWTQIDAIARADVPCRTVEWRLPCQMNCRKCDCIIPLAVSYCSIQKAMKYQLLSYCIFKWAKTIITRKVGMRSHLSSPFN